ncbi:MAG: ribosomal protein L13e, partial [Candidatus Freyarchaeota archaeon]|nr:ribosomal protein L13e [Candidatus Jordarchaeia archaeon]
KEVFCVSDLKPIVRIPKEASKVREGRGFSLGELKEANITLQDAKKIGLRVDVRRRSVHKENVESLKSFMKELQKAKKKAEKVAKKVEKKKEEVAEERRDKVKEAPGEMVPKEGAPLTTLKGLGPKTAEKLKEVGIESVEELAEEDAELLSEATGISVQKLSSWINEAKQLVKEKK